jgi:beta-lactamase superfamily II metal-dependent hydrolase
MTKIQRSSWCRTLPSRAGWLPALLLASTPLMAQTPKTLDIYFVDTEGGQASLFVAPSGQTVLVDTGNTGTRDPARIVQAATAAGVKQIDYLLITHYHGDHIGGFLELSKQIPILHYIDHGRTVQPEQNGDSKQAYDSTVATAPHVIARPGDRVPVAGIDWTIVSSGGNTLQTVLTGAPGAGKPNAYCNDYKPKDIKNDLENAQSVGSVVSYGKFRLVDLGDLLWNWESQLACPVNRIGTVDVFLTTHHGLAWSNTKVLVYALHPRVIIMNNGSRKGAEVETFQMMEASPGLEDLWQLHWSVNGLLEYNAPSRFIANVETPATTAAIIANPPSPPVMGAPRERDFGDPNHSPAYWIKVSALSNGTFTVTNSRNGFSKTYEHH